MHEFIYVKIFDKYFVNSDRKLKLFNATKLVWQQESFYGFWRGLSPVSNKFMLLIVFKKMTVI